MPKVKYLTEDKSGKKLRRKVPQELCELAGKTAWVERVSGSGKELRELANLFAVKTDEKIRTLRKRIASTQTNASADPAIATGFKINLTKTDAKRLAYLYFQRREEKQLLSRGYSSGIGDAERIADAAADYANALRAAAGEEPPSREDLLDFEALQGVEGLQNVEALRAYESWHREPPISAHAERISLGLLLDANFVDAHAIERSPAGGRRGRKQLVAPAWLRDHQNFQTLCRLIEEAEVELARRHLEYLQTGVAPEIKNELILSAPPERFSGKPVSAENSYRLGDLASAFEALKSDEGVSTSRQSQYQIVLRSLREELGTDMALQDVTRKHCEDLVQLYLRIPSHATQHYPDLTLRASAEAYEKSKGQSAARYDAAQKNLAILKSIFEYAVELEWREDNPTEKVVLRLPRKEKIRQARNKGYEPFTTEELQKIFNAPLYTGCQDDERGAETPGPNIIRRHRYWVPLIALFSGMRAGEILQLEKGDIKGSGNDVTYFDVDDEPWAEGTGVEKRLKNENARRKVPFHPELKRLGFLDYVQSQPEGRLFPDAPAGSGGKLSDHFSKRFAYFLKKRGVWVARKKVFHSFRGTFTDCLKDAQVPLDMREAILGWGPAGKMDARYGSGFTVDTLYDQVARSSYPDLDLSHLAAD